MSNKAVVKWGTILKICQDRGIEVMRGKGGECKLKGPSPNGPLWPVMRISHLCCRTNRSEVWVDYVKKFQRNYGVTDEEIWG